MTVTFIRLGWLLVSTALFSLLAYGLSRPQFTGLLGLYFLAFWGYSIRIRAMATLDEENAPDSFLMGAAVLFRLALLFAPPSLSDDYARFVWDGRLLISGYNPYLYLPNAIANTDLARLAHLDADLFGRLNSPAYYTVYPPINQLFFGLAAWFGGDSLPATVIWLRAPILLAELGTLYLLPRLLRRLGQHPNGALLYALNPLVILELTGNLHFEAVVIFLCLWAAWLLTSSSLNVSTSRLAASAGVLALAVGTKMLPLIGLPLLVRHLGWQRGLFYAGVVASCTLLFFLPFADARLLQNLGSSVNLYFQKFEFNASVYYLVREAGYWIRGYNIIQQAGPWLSLLTLTGILWIAFARGLASLGRRLLFTLTWYFALATTVHPWYITLVVAASVFTPFRYPLVWSALVWSSYATYQREPYRENLWLTLAEYTLVAGVGLAEWWYQRRSREPGLS